MLLSLSFWSLNKTTASEVAEQEGDPKQPISEEERKEQVKRFVLSTADVLM